MTAPTGPVSPARVRGSPVGPPERRSRGSLGPMPRNKRDERVKGLRRPGTESLWGVLAAFAFLVVAAVMAVFGFSESRPTAGGLLFVPVAALMVTPLIRWTAKGQTNFDLRGVLYLGFAARVLGAVVRYRYFAVDSLVYNREGERIATYLRQFNFSVDTGRQIPGTGSVRYMSGITHVFTFDDAFASFLFFTTLSFVGCCLFVKAFEVGVREGDMRRYGLLVALMPSLVFWPSSIGKEALMICTVGLSSLGAAYLLRDRWSKGAVVTMVGVGITTLVRPHVALIVLIAVAAMVFMPRERRSNSRFMLRMLAVLVFVLGGSFLARETASLFNKDDRSGETVDVESALANAQDQTAQGGSRYSPVRIRTPLDYPLAFGTVFFRPLPTEARDINGIISSVEALLIAGLGFASVRRYRHFWTTMKGSPYLAYALVFIVIFAYAFSAIGNFGILVRQRSQAWPLLLVLAALPVADKGKETVRGARRRIPARNPKPSASRRKSGRLDVQAPRVKQEVK